MELIMLIEGIQVDKGVEKLIEVIMLIEGIQVNELTG
jgi:hypothetical protein